MGGKRLTTEDFIERAKKVHGDKYCYKKSEYVTGKKIKIICPKHGMFQMLYYNHIKGQGCPTCGKISSKSKKFKTNDRYLSDCVKIYGDSYDLSNVKYKGYNQKVTIGCYKHGYFLVRADMFLMGNGCPKCAMTRAGIKRSINKEQFVKRAKKIHGNFYDYSESVINPEHKECDIICPVHGKFSQQKGRHLLGAGCPKCAQEKLTGGYNVKKAVRGDFDGKIGSVYLVKIKNDNEVFCKIGITSMSPNKRFKGFGTYNVCDSVILEDLNIKKAVFIEALIKNKWINYKYNPSQKINGYTECFHESAFDGIRDDVVYYVSREDELLRWVKNHTSASDEISI